MIPLVEVLQRTERFFREKGIPSPRLDAELILGHVLGLERVGIYLQFDRPLTEAELATLRPLVRNRGNRQSIAHVLGHKEFYDLDFLTPSKTLVPRPDTETLVEAALALLPAEEERFIADIGCGTGAVGLAILANRPLAKLFATDLSPDAIAATKENSKRLGLAERAAVLKGNLLEPIPPARAIDVVVSNPPYIPSAEIEGLTPEIKEHEPRLALDGGPDGLDVYRKLIPAAAARARVAVLVEVGDGQHEAVEALFRESGLREVRTLRDLSGAGRVVEGRLP